ncbi:hypothetical protein GCM10011425_19790 [Mucilaginibacter galii]|uniref:Protease n=2 Tax=Mucilaginibacter galii TaxID=2005073 RepID=A0A917N362_9SPHI|nr:hypothetical protein GCM10011425_19790 [Mucilaginibacter galii]
MNSHNSAAGSIDTANTGTMPDTTAKELIAEMSMPANVKAGDSVLLKFTVKNNTDSVQRFCKWHTPFEPLLSKYLDVKNDKGEDVAYQGAMAKRIMPPPESSYLSLNPKDSISANVDLLKAYAIKTPGNYTITYVGENMSGLKVKKSVSFIYR